MATTREGKGESRTVYSANARRSGSRWAIKITGLPDAATVARRLDQISASARDAIVTSEQVAPDSFDIEVVYDLEEGLDQQVMKALAAKGRAAAAQAEASNLQRVAARTMSDEGYTTRDIGVILGISHQRVAQLLSSQPEDTFGAAIAGVFGSADKPLTIYEVGRPRRRILKWDTAEQDKGT